MTGRGFPKNVQHNANYYLFSLFGVTTALAIITSCAPFEPQPRVQTLILPGPHAALECTSCHFDEPPFDPIVWDINCISCHTATAERQELGKPDSATWGPAHYPATAATTCSSNGVCHKDVDLTWITAAENCGGDVDHEFLPLEGEHAIGCTECHTGASCDTFSGADVVNVQGEPIAPTPPNLCMACHEYDRIAYNENHYVNNAVDNPVGSEPRWDCKACHDPQSREATALVDRGFYIYQPKHGDPGIRVPHGVFGRVDGGDPVAQPQDQWVTACVDCHLAGEPVIDTSFVCTDACHTELFVVDLEHEGYAQGEADVGCYVACHLNAQYTIGL